MNVLKAISGFFSKVGAIVMKGVKYAHDAGLTDDIVNVALPYVREASKKFVDNDERREWVVKALVARKVPESIARIAVELAYRIYKTELAKVGV